MTKPEFIKILQDEANAWLGTTDRAPSSWWLSIQDLAEKEFNKTYDKEVEQL